MDNNEKTKYFDIVGLDCPSVDIVLNFERFPVPDTSIEIDEYSWQGGGKVSTGVVAAARLGACCAILGTVGDDEYGRFCIEDFERHGVDTSGLLKRKDKNTGFAVVFSDRTSHGRCVTWSGTTAEKLGVDELPENYLKNTKYLYLSKTDDLSAYMAKMVRDFGGQVLIDADYREDIPEDFYPLIDIFIGSEFCYNRLFDGGNCETNCRSIIEKGPNTVLFTFGGGGCAGISDNGYFHLPAHHVSVVDTLGAGDVFHGAFVAGLLQGWTAIKSARFANAVAAIKCTRIGGRAAIPDFKTAMEYIKNGCIDYSEIDKRVLYYRRKIPGMRGAIKDGMTASL